jgi:hypothetical protein
MGAYWTSSKTTLVGRYILNKRTREPMKVIMASNCQSELGRSKMSWSSTPSDLYPTGCAFATFWPLGFRAGDLLADRGCFSAARYGLVPRFVAIFEIIQRRAAVSESLGFCGSEALHV